MNTETIEAPKPKTNTWLNRERFQISQETYDAFKRVKKQFGCRLCGKIFKSGDGARWIYCNSTPDMTTGNFFVCADCDGSDVDVMKRAKESFETAVKLAKQWDIYGPDWGHG